MGLNKKNIEEKSKLLDWMLVLRLRNIILLSFIKA